MFQDITFLFKINVYIPIHGVFKSQISIFRLFHVCLHYYFCIFCKIPSTRLLNRCNIILLSNCDNPKIPLCTVCNYIVNCLCIKLFTAILNTITAVWKLSTNVFSSNTYIIPGLNKSDFFKGQGISQSIFTMV